ncbi:MAG: HmuY family protein [Calditrichaeota bacterium]|nr:HmuY family protein [Calditrichota bacterium]
MYKVITVISALILISCESTGSDDTLSFGKKENVFYNIERGDTLNYSYFSFATGDTIQVTNPKTDTNWDLAFGLIQKENPGPGPQFFDYWGIYTNGGVSGNANGGGICLDTLYGDLNTITAEIKDAIVTDSLDTDGDPYPAVGTKSGSWYSYNPDSHQNTPDVKHTFIIRTADGRYAKVQILEMYYLDEASQQIDLNQPNYLSFRYTFQEDPNSDDLSSN